MGWRWDTFWTKLVLMRLVCEAQRCGKPRVGFSRYCRQHTDVVLNQPESEWPEETR